ncbi:MAG: TlpA disulfide reductase family protein [Bryobacteraceae bacterium]
MTRASKIHRIASCWCLLLILAPVLPAWSEPQSDDVAQAAAALEQRIDKAPKFSVEWRLHAAIALRGAHPELSRHFMDAALEPVRAGQSRLPGELERPLVETAPEEAAALLPNVDEQTAGSLLFTLFHSGHKVMAIQAYHDAAAKGRVSRNTGLSLAGFLASEQSPEAVVLFKKIAASYADADLEPQTAQRVLWSTEIISRMAPAVAADVCERILKLALAPGYAAQGPRSVTRLNPALGGFETVNPRASIVAEASSRLRTIAPERFAKYKDAVSRMGLSEPALPTPRPMEAKPIQRSAAARPLGVSLAPGAGPVPPAARLRMPPPPPKDSVSRHLDDMRAQGNDDERAKLAIALAAEIGALPDAQSRYLSAHKLYQIAIENDVGKDALAAVANVLGRAIFESARSARDYLLLANLIRYKHAPVPIQDASLDAAIALLALRDAIRQETDFSLDGMDGNTYTLSSLRGKVVLVHFWALLHPVYIEALARLERLYQEFRTRGLVVLVVSAMDRRLLESFAKSPNYSFPFLLDPERKVHAAFSVEGIPRQSYLFDRQGRMAAQSIDICSERQFREMLEQVGLY